jgi:hypothetical protein
MSKERPFIARVGYVVETQGKPNIESEDEKVIIGSVPYLWYANGVVSSSDVNMSLPEEVPDEKLDVIRRRLGTWVIEQQDWELGRLFSYLGAKAFCFAYIKNNELLLTYFRERIGGYKPTDVPLTRKILAPLVDSNKN